MKRTIRYPRQKIKLDFLKTKKKPKMVHHDESGFRIFDKITRKIYRKKGGWDSR